MHREVLSRAAAALLQSMEAHPLIRDRVLRHMGRDSQERIARRMAKRILLAALEAVGDTIAQTQPDTLRQNPYLTGPDLTRMEVPADEQRPWRYCLHCEQKVRTAYRDKGLRCPECDHGTVRLTAARIREETA